MDQKGVKIKQVSGIIFILKTIIYINILVLFNPWAATTISEEFRGCFIRNKGPMVNTLHSEWSVG
jgi:hypothetical protein